MILFFKKQCFFRDSYLADYYINIIHSKFSLIQTGRRRLGLHCFKITTTTGDSRQFEKGLQKRESNSFIANDGGTKNRVLEPSSSQQQE
jgi:hypothetical protein